MEYHMHVILATLLLAFAASQAASPEEDYWNLVLPNTPMPRAISNVLRAGNGCKRKHFTLGTSENAEMDEVMKPDQGHLIYIRQTYISSTRPEEHEMDEVLLNPPSAPWFLEKDLYAGNQMEMAIPRPENGWTTFIPRSVADSIPFSSGKFTIILDQLSVKPNSGTAQLMKDTIKKCELPAEEGQTKTCATSLESMIDFSINKLGKSVQALSTEAEKDTKLQNFTILEGTKKIADKEAVVCHKENYPYAVFYCHDVEGARAYSVPFVGDSGIKVKAVGACHTNTSGWNPEHEAFKILKVKPGGQPVCHFLPEYNVLWTRK